MRLEPRDVLIGPGLERAGRGHLGTAQRTLIVVRITHLLGLQPNWTYPARGWDRCGCNFTSPDQQHATLSRRLTSPIPKAPQAVEAFLDGKCLAEALGQIEALVPVVIFELHFRRK